jgi:MFS family permease
MEARLVRGLRVYRDLLANQPLTRLLVGEFISGIGDWLYIVAIFVVIYRESGDAALVGLFGGLRLVPYILLSIPAGLVADRFERRLVLLASDIGRGIIMVLLTILVTINGPVWAIAGLALVAAGFSAFFYPAIGAYLPSLVTDERQLGPANSAWASLGNVSFIVGPAIGGVLLAIGGVTLAFILNALTFVVIGAILLSLPPSARVIEPALDATDRAPEPPADADKDAPAKASAAAAPDQMPASGSKLALRPLTGLAMIQLLAGFLEGGIQVLTVILAIAVLHAGEAANGYLNAAIGFGGLIGAIGSGVLVLRRALGAPLIIGAVITAAGLALLGAIPVLAIALFAIAFASAGMLIMEVVTTTIFQRIVPDALRGRWIGVLMTVSTIAGAAGAIALPVLVVNIGAAPSLGASGVALIAASVAGLVLIGGAATRPMSRFEATLAEVAKLPIFAGVPASRLEAALAHLREVPVKAGEAVIRQGEPADRFYMIESGNFVVTQQSQPDGPAAVLRRLGPNEVFGELGLLREAPRTATVTAESDGTLLALDGADFLRLVGASGALRNRLLGLYIGAGSPGPS